MAIASDDRPGKRCGMTAGSAGSAMSGAPHSSSPEPLAGRRILIVEDESMIALMIALMIQDVLADLGSVVVGPAARIETALELATTAPIDLAVLDLNLVGESVHPVAEALAKRGIPFVFTTGYGQRGIAEVWRDRPSLLKPFRPSQLAALLRTTLSVLS